MLLGRNFDDIDAATIRSLIEAEAPESVHLEFKRETYGRSDAAKKEFLKDISAFANTLGGHLIIGIDEKNGAASGLAPMDSAGIDDELQRLENLAGTGIEPAIVGLRMKRIDVEGGSIILIHVPRSYNPPHRVTSGNSNRYHGRHSAGIYELSLDELRRLFGEQRSIEERASAFVRERFLRIQSGDGAMPIPASDGALVMHLVPLPDFGAERRFEIADLREQQNSFTPIFHRGFSQRINLDGVNVFYSEGSYYYSYTQIFRNGAVEATDAWAVAEHQGRRSIPGLSLAQKLFRALGSYMAGLRALEATPPVLLQLSFMGMTGVTLATGRFDPFGGQAKYPRDVLHLPSSLITAYRDDGNYQSVIAEQMDFLWNAFGVERCPYFDEDGTWTGQ